MFGSTYGTLVKTADRGFTRRIRFEYEYGGKSIEYLLNKYAIEPDSLDRVIKEQNWTQKTVDPFDPKAVNQFYSDARKKLSIEAVQRAVTLFLDIIDLEDSIMQDLQKKLRQADSADEPYVFSVTELTKVMKMIDMLKNSTKIYSEAFEVPATADRDIKDLLNSMEPSDIATLTQYIKDNGIPVPDIPIEDMPDEQ